MHAEEDKEILHPKMKDEYFTDPVYQFNKDTELIRNIANGIFAIANELAHMRRKGVIVHQPK